MDYANTGKLASFLHRLRDGEPLLLLTLGDSNTCNMHFSGGAKQWPELLHARLKDVYQTQRLLLLNAGVAGDTILDGLARFDTDVARFRPDLVIVCFGTNDANRITDSAFHHGLNTCLDRLDALGASVVLRTTPPIMERHPAPPHIWPDDVVLARKVAITREIAASRALPLVDIYQLWRDAEAAGDLSIAALMVDEVHTNAAGHRRVAQDLYPMFQV